MTEQTIRIMAKELAGKFYEQKRSGHFRDPNSLTRAKRMTRDPQTGIRKEVTVVLPFSQAYPTAQSYVNAWWPFFVEAARKALTAMLAQPDARIHPHMKERIFDALIEDREREVHNGAKRLHQRQAVPFDKDSDLPFSDRGTSVGWRGGDKPRR